MNRPCLGLLLVSLSWTSVALGQTAQAPGHWPQWRGPDRDGISPETGLLKEWLAGRQCNLVAVSEKEYRLSGSLSLEKARPHTLTMPVIAGSRLYLREQDVLYCYDIKAKPRSRGPRPPFVPTPQDVVEKMLDLAAVKKDDVVVDLGCGDGRIVVTAAQKYGCKAIGYDLGKECLRLASESVKKNQLEERVRIVEDDIFNVDLSKVDVVTLYLFSTTNVKLIPQFEKMKPGSRIVSHAADMEGVKPDKVITVKSIEDEQERKLYLWTVPLKKER